MKMRELASFYLTLNITFPKLLDTYQKCYKFLEEGIKLILNRTSPRSHCKHLDPQYYYYGLQCSDNLKDLCCQLKTDCEYANDAYSDNVYPMKNVQFKSRDIDLPYLREQRLVDGYDFREPDPRPDPYYYLGYALSSLGLTGANFKKKCLKVLENACRQIPYLSSNIYDFCSSSTHHCHPNLPSSSPQRATS
ncbi:hypothetical protein PCK1_000507 [Pneumocystis canis]|nr:hypothetical protein PCK1_000507 [Pneumocystis canis]